MRREIHLLLRQVSHDYDRLQYNTVVSGAMKMLNAIDDARLADSPADNAVLLEAFSILLRTLYPAAPHIAHALWVNLGYAAHHADLFAAPWPEVDEDALVQDEIELMLQVSGKLRGAIRVPAHADRSAIEAAAQAVLDARAAHPDSSLADLYDPLTMPPDLVKAHQKLDAAVDASYGYKGGSTDAARVAFLFGLYQQLTSLLPADGGKPRRARRVNAEAV